MTSALAFNLDVHQSRAFRMVQPGRTVTLPWGRGSGKTHLARALIHHGALDVTNQHVGILYPTLKQARAVIWEGPTGLFADCSALMRAGLIRRYHRGELTIEFTNGSRVSTWGAENAHAVRGQRFGRLVSDESDDIEPELERSVVQPTFSKSGLDAVWVKFGTPRRGRHGSIYPDFAEAEQQAKGYRRAPDGTWFYAPAERRTHYGFRVRSDESPQVDQRWLAGVKADLYAKGKGATYEREYNCNFDASEGLVYPVFHVDTHVREPAPDFPWSEIIVGVDHGWNDPGVFLPFGVIGNGRDAIMWGLEEVYQTGKNTDWWCARAVEVAGRYRNFRQRWYADPSRPDRISEIDRAVRKEGIEGFTIEPAKNEIEAGVDALADRLAVQEGSETPRFFIAPGCANAIAEFGKYRRKRDPKNTERVLDDIVDKDNHALDAARYACFTRFGKPENVRTEYDPYGSGQ